MSWVGKVIGKVRILRMRIDMSQIATPVSASGQRHSSCARKMDDGEWGTEGLEALCVRIRQSHFLVSCVLMGWNTERWYLTCHGATSAGGGDRERGKVLHAGWNNDRYY